MNHMWKRIGILLVTLFAELPAPGALEEALHGEGLYRGDERHTTRRGACGDSAWAGLCEKSAPGLQATPWPELAAQLSGRAWINSGVGPLQAAAAEWGLTSPWIKSGGVAGAPQA